MTSKVIEGPVIRAGESVSEPLDCTAGQIVRIVMPSDWSTDHKSPALTFAVSTDGNEWYDLFDRGGYEINIETIVPHSTVIILVNQITNSWVRFRSGSRMDPVAQSEERRFQTIVELDAAQTAPTPPGGDAGGAGPVKMFFPQYGWVPGYGFVGPIRRR